MSRFFDNTLYNQSSWNEAIPLGGSNNRGSLPLITELSQNPEQSFSLFAQFWCEIHTVPVHIPFCPLWFSVIKGCQPEFALLSAPFLLYPKRLHKILRRTRLYDQTCSSAKPAQAVRSRGSMFLCRSDPLSDLPESRISFRKIPMDCVCPSWCHWNSPVPDMWISANEVHLHGISGPSSRITKSTATVKESG